ncbi:MAG: hypothetical protein PHT94_03605 [Candidatus Nanoarchaeia archaeon]|nr:hypothetical protein [Candidatus Nanoarchaeia archaeon]
MKELEINMVSDLIKIYKSYINNGITEEFKKNTKEIENKYLNSSPLVNSDLTNAKAKLTYFYEDIFPGPINKDEAKEIVKNLENIKKKIKNDKS